MSGVSECGVLGLGNPLLDLLVRVDDELCAKYQLKRDDAILAEERHMPLYEEVQQKYDVKYAAGGATLNTIKMIQWILREPRRCAYIGCIADDEAGKLLQRDCEISQLQTSFELARGQTTTGKCAVLIRGNHRTMVTHLGACKEQTVDFVTRTDNWKLVETAQIYYIAGYVINSCFDGLFKIAEHSKQTGKLFSFNLSAPFLPLYYTDQVDSVLPYVDILFANRAEAEAYGEKHGMSGSSLVDLIKHLASIPPTGTAKRKRIVVVTQDIHPVLVAQTGDEQVSEYPVRAATHIVDTTGAGDAFAAGFLAEFAVSRSVERSVTTAMKAARYIIQQSGFILADREAYDQYD